MSNDNRRDYGSGSIYFDEKRNVWIASVDYRDPADGRRRFRRKSAKPNARGTAPKELRDWLDSQRWRKADGEIIDPVSLTVAEWFTTWLQVHKPDIRAKTRESYDGIICNRIIPKIGAVKLTELDGTLLQRFINEQAKFFSSRGAQYVRVILKMGLKDAVRLGYLKTNPAEYVKAPRKTVTEIVPPTEAMILKMLETAQSTMFGTYFLVVAASGARRGEILALRWADVDLKLGCIKIMRTMVYTKIEKVQYNEPKTANGKRTILLPKDVMTALKLHEKAIRKMKKDNKDIWEENDLVFPVQSGGPQNPHNIENAFYRIMEKAGLGKTVEEKGKDGTKATRFKPAFRIHDLRHAQASMLMMSGENPEAVRKRMGHHSAAFTMAVYTHASQTIDRQIADKLQGKYFRKNEESIAKKAPAKSRKKRKT